MTNFLAHENLSCVNIPIWRNTNKNTNGSLIVGSEEKKNYNSKREDNKEKDQQEDGRNVIL